MTLGETVRTKRWIVVGPCIAASIIPSAFLTSLFAAPGTFLQELPETCLGFLLGPLCQYRYFANSADIDWICLAIVLAPTLVAHAVWPRVSTAVVTSAGFLIWYGAAFLVVVRTAP